MLPLTGALRFSGVRVGEVMGLTPQHRPQTVIDLVLLRRVRNRSRWG